MEHLHWYSVNQPLGSSQKEAGHLAQAQTTLSDQRSSQLCFLHRVEGQTDPK